VSGCKIALLWLCEKIRTTVTADPEYQEHLVVSKRRRCNANLTSIEKISRAYDDNQETLCFFWATGSDSSSSSRPMAIFVRCLSVDSHKMDCTRHATKMPVLCVKLKAFSRTSIHEIFWHSIIISGVIGLVSAKKSYLNEQQNVYPALKTMVSERPHPNFRPSVSQPDDLPKMYSTVTAEPVNG
jgi:hypothetical protein